MEILKRLARFFAPPEVCGALCRDVAREVETIRLAGDLQTLDEINGRK